jgi:Ni,Fe-hydrogenase I cytochrome b subunit
MSNVMTTDECTFERIYLYTRFERFWHWVQSAFVVLLGLTGYEIHTGYNLFGFQRAVEWHNVLGSPGWFSMRLLSSGI